MFGDQEVYKAGSQKNKIRNQVVKAGTGGIRGG